MFRGHRNRDVCVLLDYVLSAERDDISKVEGSRLIVVMLKRGDPVTPQPLSSCRGSFEVSYTSTRLLLFCFRDFLQKNSRNRKHWHLTEERELIAKASFVAELDTARSRNLPGFTSLALLSTTGSRPIYMRSSSKKQRSTLPSSLSLHLGWLRPLPTLARRTTLYAHAHQTASCKAHGCPVDHHKGQSLRSSIFASELICHVLNPNPKSLGVERASQASKITLRP